MKTFDVVVLGAGDAGLSVAFQAAENFKVALLEKALPGGTCVNNGCVPSKTLIHAADVIMEIRNAERLGIRAALQEMNFRSIMDRMRNIVSEGRNGITDAIKETANLEFIQAPAHFIDGHTLEAGGERIRGKKIFIASGARPVIPPLKGLDEVPFLTNESVLTLEKLPESMIIIGGGYVGVEYAHFFATMGTKVTLMNRNTRLLPSEDHEISGLLMREMGKRVHLLSSVEISEVRQEYGKYSVRFTNSENSQAGEVSAKSLMVATGRKSNADLLGIEKAGVATDDKNFIRVDDYLRTNKRHIWAVGDCNGKAMFTHAGDREAEIAWNNATLKKKVRMDFDSVPHAVFTYPQIAAIGLSEEKARKEHDVLVGKAMYSGTVMGEAMAEHDGFAKAVMEKKTGKILGFHIIGPHAAMLIQEVVNAVIQGHGSKSITGSMHIFPALTNLIPDVFSNIKTE